MITDKIGAESESPGGIEAADPLSRCIACGNSQFKIEYKVTDTNQGVPGEWNLKVCEACGLGMIDPLPTQNDVTSFYVDQFYAEDGKRFQGWVECLRVALSWLRGVDLKRVVPGKGRLLDFGAGSGHFAKVQKARGWEVYSVDPYSSKADSSDRCKMEGDRIKLEFPDHYFDAVTLWYVIEHLRNPDDAIAEFKRVLRPDGVLVLAQQDFASVQARLFGPRWLILDPPRHIWQFSERSLLKLVARHGYKKRFISHASIELGPYTILQSTLNCLVGNKNYLFCLLKNGRLRSKGYHKSIPLGRAIVSVALGIALLPLCVVFYFLLLAFGSGDVFTLYLQSE
ncbi:MAG TPA: class I SAM-dependent methyltransferase [Syntrophorhabdales bacterium]|nr:class I SAM-dependent methyltransferase [Syntrophorhabdales bacterium]